MKTGNENTTSVELIRVMFLRRSDELLYKYGFTALFFIGMPANLFAFVSILYRRLYAKSQMFVFFMFMTGMDAVRVGTECGEAFIRSWVYVYLPGPEDTYSIHGWSVIISRYFGDAAMKVSTWTLIFANAYKLYGLVKPLRVKPSDKKIAFWACAFISVCFYAENMITLLGYRVLPTDIGRNNTLYMNINFMEYYKSYIINYYFPYGVVIYSILPGILFVVLSIAILITFGRLYKKHLSMTQQESSDSSAYKTAKTSIMALLPLSVVHIAFTLPGVVSTINIDLLSFSYLNFFLWSFNHSINVYVQMICSKYYRDSILGRK